MTTLQDLMQNARITRKMKSRIRWFGVWAEPDSTVNPARKGRTFQEMVVSWNARCHLCRIMAKLLRWSSICLLSWHVLAALDIKRQNIFPFHLDPVWPCDCFDPQNACSWNGHSWKPVAILWEAQAVWWGHGEENQNALVEAPDEPKADSHHQCHPYEWAILDIPALSPRRQ